MTKCKVCGFTLVEIVITIAIMAIITAIAIPNVNRMRIHANEQAVISALKMLHTSTELYKEMYNAYPNNFSSTIFLYNASMIPSTFKTSWNSTYHGYTFVYQGDANPAIGFYWAACLIPTELWGTIGSREFRISKSGIMEENRNASTAYCP